MKVGNYRDILFIFSAIKGTKIVSYLEANAGIDRNRLRKKPVRVEAR